MAEVVDLYLCGADAAQPLASPVLADFPNAPPTLIQVGAEEILLSDAERIAHKMGARLEVWPDCPHVWQMFDPRLPEARDAMRQAAEFIQTSFESASRKPTASAT
jgi:acetyl esterase/lipase